jgi:hypothetical protein
MCSFAIAGDMPMDCRQDAGGALLFRSKPLDAPLDILGQPSVALKVAADKTQAFVAVLLVDEAPDGAQSLISRGYCNFAHRHGDTVPVSVTPGEEMAVTVPLHGIAYRLASGHRLMVQVASAYWPILWPAPEPVTLTLRAGMSALDLPVRDAPVGEPEPRPLPPPPSREKPRPAAKLRDGALDRSLSIDQTTGMHKSRFYIDGGVFGPVGRMRLETGTELGDVSERRYEIHPYDPLSARATMEQETLFERGAWKARIRTISEQTATATEFVLKARIECWDGETLFHEVNWGHRISRNGM